MSKSVSFGCELCSSDIRHSSTRGGSHGAGTGVTWKAGEMRFVYLNDGLSHLCGNCLAQLKRNLARFETEEASGLPPIPGPRE